LSIIVLTDQRKSRCKTETMNFLFWQNNEKEQEYTKLSNDIPTEASKQEPLQQKEIPKKVKYTKDEDCCKLHRNDKQRDVVDKYTRQIWALFCEIHQLPATPDPIEVGHTVRFGKRASLCWVTDVCDILQDNQNGRFIIRRKAGMLRF